MLNFVETTRINHGPILDFKGSLDRAHKTPGWQRLGGNF